MSTVLPRLARWTLLVGLALAVVLHADALASNNLLPRRIGFHLAAAAACALVLLTRARAQAWPLAGVVDRAGS
ncbi:MAG: hypothetical protein DYH12_30155 [Sorangiineae bacterium PRO1]|nr:hypothetical protein [Sorangiineae bacterium PRO1]